MGAEQTWLVLIMQARNMEIELDAAFAPLYNEISNQPCQDHQVDPHWWNLGTNVQASLQMLQDAWHLLMRTFCCPCLRHPVDLMLLISVNLALLPPFAS